MREVKKPKSYKQLKEEGKIEFLSPEESRTEMAEFREYMDAAKRQHVIKNAKSIQSAKEAILTH
jgi:hypothetical protein